jgi:small subunit ribosomal protein S6
LSPYEITFIIRPDMDDEETRAAIDQVTGRIESAGGEIIASYPWGPGRRRMAYPIRDFGDGVYVTATFRIDPNALGEIENALKLNERVLRFLIVQASDAAIKHSQQRAQQAAAAAAAPPTVPGPAETPVQPEPAAVAPQPEPVAAETAAEAPTEAAAVPTTPVEEPPSEPEAVVEESVAPAPDQTEAVVAAAIEEPVTPAEE